MRGWLRPKSASACPFCGCRKLWRNRGYLRTVLTLEGPKTRQVTQRKCSRCGRTCADPLPGVEKGARYAKEVKREAVRALFELKLDVTGTVKEMGRRFGWSPSPSTVRMAMDGAP